MSVEHLIGDLLLRHNCVVVPAFGGFVARQTSATLDFKTGTMLPPGKSLLFNKQLINNDGLLIASYARETGLSYDVAALEIKTQVATWQIRLHNGERVNLEKVGFLFLDQEKNIGFEQDKFFNLLLQSYGMGKVHFVSEEDIQIIAHSEIKTTSAISEGKMLELYPEGISIVDAAPAEKAAKIVELPRQSGAVKIWRYVAAVALLPIAFYSYWIPMKTNVLESGVFAIQDFNPFHSNKSEVYASKNYSFKVDTTVAPKVSVKEQTASIADNVETYAYEYDEALFIPVHLNDAKAEVKKVEIASGQFYLIANCFSSEENAVNFVKFLKSEGLDAMILDVQNGLHRVSAGSSVLASDLKSIENQIQTLGVSGAWILKK